MFQNITHRWHQVFIHKFVNKVPRCTINPKQNCLSFHMQQPTNLLCMIYVLPASVPNEKSNLRTLLLILSDSLCGLTTSVWIRLLSLRILLITCPSMYDGIAKPNICSTVGAISQVWMISFSAAPEDMLVPYAANIP